MDSAHFSTNSLISQTEIVLFIAVMFEHITEPGKVIQKVSPHKHEWTLDHFSHIVMWSITKSGPQAKWTLHENPKCLVCAVPKAEMFMYKKKIYL